MIPADVMRLLSLDEIAHRPEMLACQPAKEIAETRLAWAAVGAALDAAGRASLPVTPTEPDRALSVDEAIELYPVVTRKWLFSHAGRVPFIKRLGKKTLSISQRGLARNLGIA
jgi:hypothetical protein